ncbi:hypothetical protein PPL_08127 [Heterostelium album PN500]|uniref:Uncharacterized protein n=1 Tax=Heterostelium pallidum (strain ATCC 26659 / Pp 5 / PN500) TaxID=670386 RepID=D3BIP4_HETP5|nr:hypothetical protein PPL_08127 [Heterostelium album PN500]EFA78668.1 hypothetical protein PPL_08127 [Heterostelium album PN500]|eukprot:XP_020430792.1 hypothetical protein PPL_08127 [Heterostelium album PN500]
MNKATSHKLFKEVITIGENILDTAHFQILDYTEGSVEGPVGSLDIHEYGLYDTA